MYNSRHVKYIAVVLPSSVTETTAGATVLHAYQDDITDTGDLPHASAGPSARLQRVYPLRHIQQHTLQDGHRVDGLPPQHLHLG